MLRGRNPIRPALGRRSRGARRALLLAAASATGLALPGSSAAARLPPVQIAYSGKVSVEVFPTKGKPAHQLRTLSWTATAGSAGSDGSLALDFSSVSGSASSEGNGNCYDATTTLSLATAHNPVAGGWFLNESSDYPSSGWKYIAQGVPSTVPVLESSTGRCSSFEVEELPQPNEMLLKQETLSPTQIKEYEALFDPLEFSPGKPATRTRSFSFDGTSHCACLPEETHVKESMTLTVSATSPAAGNTIGTRPGSGGGSGSGPKAPTPPRRRSEARRREMKEQARADLGPALEEAWKAHGLAAVIGLNSGSALSTVLDELGQQSALIGSNDATARAINDYRIVKDPPDRSFHQLAKARPARPPALPSCPSGERAACTSLRGAEAAMLTYSARAEAITAALLVTIDRDSGAIRARDYAAAQRQYLNFERLHAELNRVLRSRSADGERVETLLRGQGVDGEISSAQSAAAIGEIEKELSHAGISAAKLGPLAGDSLQAREADALAALGA